VFRLVNHGVPRDLTARLFRLTLDLLDTDPGEKELPGYFGGMPALSLRVKENVAHMAHIARKMFDALADGGVELALDAAQRPAGASTWWSTGWWRRRRGPSACRAVERDAACIASSTRGEPAPC
jgi:hypothetical protein